MDPLSASAATRVNVLQALLVNQGLQAPDVSALLALLGKDVDALLQSLFQGGANLRLASGQMISAQGDLPYPEGTQLKVRVLPAEDTGVRLQVLEATPPSPPALLTPLFQGEGSLLMARLTQTEPSLPMEPLVRLLQVLSEDLPESHSNLPQTLGVSVPPFQDLLSKLQSLPVGDTRTLALVLGAGENASMQKTAETLESWLRETVSMVQKGGPSTFLQGPRSASSPHSAGAVGDAQIDAAATLVQAVLQKFESLVASPSAPPVDRQDFLSNWIRGLLMKAMPEADPSNKQMVLPQSTPSRNTPVVARAGNQAASEFIPLPRQLEAALSTHSGPKAELPESWEAWMRGSLKLLADPVASPRESAFHSVQGQEGTAFFEIPIPWAMGGNLQIWVESDRDQNGKAQEEATQRILLGMNFSRLGETRLGVVKSSSGLQVRIWTEHAELLKREQSQIEDELESLGQSVDLKIHELSSGPEKPIQSLRSIVMGSTLQAMG